MEHTFGEGGEVWGAESRTGEFFFLNISFRRMMKEKEIRGWKKKFCVEISSPPYDPPPSLSLDHRFACYTIAFIIGLKRITTISSI